MLLKNTSNYVMTRNHTLKQRKKKIIFFLFYVPNLYVIISYKRTSLVCLITTFCPRLKSRGFFIQGFVLLSLFLAGWGDRGSYCMAHVTGPPQTSGVLLWKPAGHVLHLSDLVQANGIWTNQ